MYTTHIILDFEMNPVGMSFPQVYSSLKQEIIEIGAIKLDSHLEVVSRFRCLVKPAYNSHITPYITKLTGICYTDVAEAPSLDEALELFTDWIGETQNCRIYSWSDNDLRQLQTECDYKKINFPLIMKRWLDFQRPFPRMMHMAQSNRRIALKEAARYFDIHMDQRKAHSALYDAEITAQLLVFFLNGEYRAQVEYMVFDERPHRLTNKLGDLCGGVLSELLRQMQTQPA